MQRQVKIGDFIKDMEDGDCYFLGEVVEVNRFGGVGKYKVLEIVWNGINEDNNEIIGKVIEPRWWYITKAKGVLSADK